MTTTDLAILDFYQNAQERDQDRYYTPRDQTAQFIARVQRSGYIATI